MRLKAPRVFSPRALGASIARWTRQLLDSVVPQKCWQCQRNVASTTPLCRDCFLALPRPVNSCARCGQQLAQNTEACGSCLGQPCAQSQTHVAFIYTGIIATKLKAFKYGRTPQLSTALTELLLSELRASCDFEVDWVVPVPSTRTKIQRRGFNPAGQIARQLSKAIGAQFKSRLLVKSNHAPSQVGSTRAKRKRQLAGTITCRLPRNAAKQYGDNALRILLVDDVLTTGSTLHTCGKVLKRAGFKQVEAITVAISG